MAALLGDCMPTLAPLLISSMSLLTLPCFTFSYCSYFFTVPSTHSAQVVPHFCLLKLHKQKAVRGRSPHSTPWSSPVSVCGWHSPDLHSPEPSLLLHSHWHVAVLVGTVTLSLSWPVRTTGTTCWEPPQNNSCVPCNRISKSWASLYFSVLVLYSLSSSHSTDTALLWPLFAFLLSHFISCTLFDNSWAEDEVYQLVWGEKGKGKMDKTSKKGFIHVSHRHDQIPLLSARVKQDVQLSKWELNHVHRDRDWKHLPLQLVTNCGRLWKF